MDSGASRLHQVLRISIGITLAAGLFHLLNLVGSGRGGFGPALITPFRISFVVSWALLSASWLFERRLPRPDRTDALIASIMAVFLLRGALTPETFSITLNWVFTGAGIFFLVRFGTRSASDVRFMLLTLVGAALVLAFYGLEEYAFKANPLFDSIQVDAIGDDSRIAASDQLYRIRSLVGHPGFVGAIMLGSMPLAFLVFRRRRLLLAASWACLGAGIFLSFSRGSWLIAALVLVPVCAVWARTWLRHNYKWLVPLLLLPVAYITFDYMNREEVSASLVEGTQDGGLRWAYWIDGRLVPDANEASGGLADGKYITFDVSDDFYYGADGPVTISVHFLDRGAGKFRIYYDAMNEGAEPAGSADSAESADRPRSNVAATAPVNKTDSEEWSTAAFYIEDPRFEGRLSGSDFILADDDGLITINEVTVQRGKLTLPGVVLQQWSSRAGSLGTRAGFFPLTIDVLSESPLGVGLYNSPGTDHHAVDSLPLTWMMEFGWPGLVLILGLMALMIRECIYAWKQRGVPAAILLLSLLLILLHGGHLMILYDKPSLVLTAAVAALYANIRPWRRRGAVIEISNHDCMV
ncbi:MAG: hypothetical protein Q7K29_03605 [Thermoleophilia bacterium]|nr:hypothetical protein [Thermoleophilia bacterium]